MALCSHKFLALNHHLSWKPRGIQNPNSRGNPNFPHLEAKASHSTTGASNFCQKGNVVRLSNMSLTGNKKGSSVFFQDSNFRKLRLGNVKTGEEGTRGRSNFRVRNQGGEGAGGADPSNEEGGGGERGSTNEPKSKGEIESLSSGSGGEELEGMESLEDDLFTEMFLESVTELMNNEISFAQFLKQATFIFLETLANSDFLKEMTWYDVDGKEVTEWSIERSHTFLLSRFGDIYSEVLMDSQSKAKRVDWILERELQRNLFAGSPFAVTAVKEGMEGERWFYGEVSGDPADAFRILDQQIKERFPDLVLNMSQDFEFDTPVCCIAYKDAMLTLPAVEGPLFFLLLAATIVFTNSLLRMDPEIISGGAALWNGCLVPLALLGVIGSAFLGQALCALAYKRPISPFYLPLPAPGFGLVGLTWRDLGLLPNRACLIDQSLASSAASAFFSFQLLTLSALPVPSSLTKLTIDYGWSDAPGALSNVILIDASLFSYSAVISELASHLSIATIPTPGGETLLAIGPFALAGILGLNMTALNLMPFGTLPGGRIMRGLGGLVGLLASSLVTAIVVIIFALMNPHSFWAWFGIGIAFSAISMYSMQRNELSSPGFIRTLLGFGFVGMAGFTLLPPTTFYWFFNQGPGALVEQLGMSLFLLN